MWESDHHVVDDVVMFGERSVTSAHHRERHCLLGTDDWIVGHIINLSIDVLLFIATSEIFKNSNFPSLNLDERLVLQKQASMPNFD